MPICKEINWCSTTRTGITTLSVLVAVGAGIYFGVVGNLNVENIVIYGILLGFLFLWGLFDVTYECLDDFIDDVKDWPFGLGIVGWLSDLTNDNPLFLWVWMNIATLGIGNFFAIFKLVNCFLSGLSVG